MTWIITSSIVVGFSSGLISHFVFKYIDEKKQNFENRRKILKSDLKF